MGRILVSGFEPFGGERVNPSVMICEGLDGEEILPARPEGGPEGRRESGRESVRASSVVLPVTWDGAVEKLVAAARGQAGGDRLLAVVMLGQAGGSPGLAVERLAVNVANGLDNAGEQRAENAVVPGGPIAYPSTLPLGAIVAAVEACGLPAFISNTAGTYLCNYVFYGFLHYLATAWGGKPPTAGFIHMPYLPEQAIGKKPIPPSLSEADIGRAVRAALRATAEAVVGG